MIVTTAARARLISASLYDDRQRVIISMIVFSEKFTSLFDK